MEKEIIAKLNEIEKTEGVRILYAAESGSRAWGFASADSDYDVRFVYARPLDDYLTVEERRDVIEYTPDEVFDVNGWDIKKTLKLLYASNPILFEWNNSPIVYRTSPEWDKVKEIINDYFRSKKGLYHYVNMAKNNNREFLRDRTEVKLKKYFYVLRPILACNWILKNNTPPPMLFTDLIAAQENLPVADEIAALLVRKINSDEPSLIAPVAAINDYIEEELKVIEEKIAGLSDDPRHDTDALNKLFVSIIKDR